LYSTVYIFLKKQYKDREGSTHGSWVVSSSMTIDFWNVAWWTVCNWVNLLKFWWGKIEFMVGLLFCWLREGSYRIFGGWGENREGVGIVSLQIYLEKYYDCWISFLFCFLNNRLNFWVNFSGIAQNYRNEGGKPLERSLLGMAVNPGLDPDPSDPLYL